MKKYEREAGVLLPISALPSPYGIGSFSKEAYDFVDMLSNADQSVWQILPLCPTAYGDSPYQSPASFGGNPYYISLDKLCEKGFLKKDDLTQYSHNEQKVDYGRLYVERYPLLYEAFSKFKVSSHSEDYHTFLEENRWWLEDTALFMAIKKSLFGAPLRAFPKELLQRQPDALKAAKRELSEEIDFWRFLQYEFFSQWKELKTYANSKGIKIMGDLPIYVSADSAEVWSRPELFCLDENRRPLSVAGCPPDGFSPAGQLWGNPLYAWEQHKEEDFSWWINRISWGLSNCDILRIDHFRGFESYYSVPFGAENAKNGSWKKGVGEEMFRAVRDKLGDVELIAEDLGFMTEEVHRLRDRFGFAGMKILQFGFNGEDEYLPYEYTENSVAYTGTHDNPTLLEWLETLSLEGESRLRGYLRDWNTPKNSLSDKAIALAMMSRSRLCIIPVQDYLNVGAEGRINRPATSEGNWSWRMKKEDISDGLARKMKDLTDTYGRTRKYLP